MKRIILPCALMLAIVYSSTAQQTETGKLKTDTVKIEEGTLLKVRSLTEISSKTASEGDILDFAMYEDLVINGKTILKEGEIVKAHIDEAEKAKGVGKQGVLRIQFDFAKTADGTKIPLRATRSGVEGEDKSTTSIALAVVVSPLFLFKKGKEAKVSPGKVMEAYVARDVQLVVD